MADSDSGSVRGTLRRLSNAGVRCSTIIDIGCADGQFFLEARASGLFVGATPLNIDSNALYEDSLKAIKDVMGGHYWIGAITDRTGEIEITTSRHPYWSSVRPSDDPYWQRINGLSVGKTVVSSKRLDSLAMELSLTPPYLLKLDVQGAEASVLSGANTVLRDTHVVICEADMSDFQDINAKMIEAGFVLYEPAEPHRDATGALCWFYPIYIKETLDVAKPSPFWDARQNDQVIEAQVHRRQLILRQNAALLQLLSRQKTAISASAITSRNALCTCGSGLRYKHCCGAHAT